MPCSPHTSLGATWHALLTPYLVPRVRWALIPGILVMFLTLPIQAKIGSTLFKYRKLQLALTDERVKVVNELVQVRARSLFPHRPPTSPLSQTYLPTLPPSIPP